MTSPWRVLGWQTCLKSTGGWAECLNKEIVHVQYKMTYRFVAVLAIVALLQRASVSGAAVPIEDYLQSCTDKNAVSTFNDTSAQGNWYLLYCFVNKNVGCSERNCIKFNFITPQKRKSLSELYTSLKAGVSWDAVHLEIFSPCSTADPNTLNPNGPSYLEKTAPGSYRLLNFPLGEKSTKMTKPRHVRLESLKGNFMLMLDCEDSDLIVLARPPPPTGYNLDQEMNALLAYSQQDY